MSNPRKAIMKCNEVGAMISMRDCKIRLGVSEVGNMKA